MLNLCFMMWCLGAEARPDHIRLMTTQDVYHNAGIVNRLVAMEGYWLIGGYIHEPDSRDAAFVGTIPLRVRLHPRVSFDGGAIVGTGEMPRRGTLVNWLARVQLRLTDVVAFEILHVSNGSPRNIANPAIDSIGVSFRLK
jgi:hypothetical protein